jgi:hypothetical protein
MAMGILRQNGRKGEGSLRSTRQSCPSSSLWRSPLPITSFPTLELGAIHLSLSQASSAIAAFTLALSFDPNHAQAQEQLAIARQHLHASQ